jgi:prephenate dehydrogenase
VFGNVTILGIGLLGASFALAMKKNRLSAQVTGYGRSRKNLEKAKELNIIDSFDLDPASACAGADLILFATPVGTFRDLAKRACGAFKGGVLVTDVGSVKGDLVYEMERLMPPDVHFIGAHPIAGSDRSGIDFSSPDMFKDAQCIITPTGNSDQDALRKTMDLWTRLGSRVIVMQPEEHDRIYASVSHLPHLIAYAMVNTVADINREYLDYCGQGFRDMTRIASSSPDIWTDISLMNKKNIAEMIGFFEKNLDTIKAYIETSQADSLRDCLDRARSLRESIG